MPEDQNKHAAPGASGAETPSSTAPGSTVDSWDATRKEPTIAPPGTIEPAQPATPVEPAQPAESDRTAALEAEVAGLKDRLLRALAETENVRRRAEREKEDAAKYAIAGFAREMVTVADNFALALQNVNAEARKADPALDALVTGVEMTQREMMNAFERAGIRAIDALGQRFDHNYHEAMYEIEEGSRPAGTVVQVIKTGYLLKDRLLRPAQVGVSKGGPKAAAAAPATTPADAGGKTPSDAYAQRGGAKGSSIDEQT